MYSITKMCNSKKDVEAVYLFLSDLCSEYSNFRQWYHDTVVPGLANGERLIYAATEAAIYECQDYAPNWLTVSVLYAINEVV